jgi:hypothetical protein
LTGLRRRLLPAAARRLIRDAGPPQWAVLTAFVLGGLVGGTLYLSGAIPLVTGLLILLVAVTIPGIVDVDGWRIRHGMAWLALEQRRRQPDIPRTPARADRWLAEHPDAPPALRASALITAGRHEEARPLLEADQPLDAVERVRRARMLAAIDGLRDGRVEASAAREALAQLPADERRYQALALAWSTAWVDALNRRPWRAAFAEASRDVPVAQIPARWRLIVAIYQLLATIMVGLLLLVVLLAGWR